RRNLKHIDTVIQNHPGEWENALTRWQRERLAVIRTLYAQQREMYESGFIFAFFERFADRLTCA
ncbi:MAG: hypothetical protein IKQ80_01400, partial [Clostridia bacterium]|nr:hypothetical protein [Clostridia bacterium]